MKISIIIPSYKPQKYIYECFRSILNQNFSKNDFEVVIILNGCNEPYLSQIKMFFFDNSREQINYRIIQTDIGGVSNARNIGLDNACGDYITFVDDDDYISPTYLQELYEIAISGVTPVSNVISFDDLTNSKIDSYLTKAFDKIVNQKCVSLIKARSFISVPVAKLLSKDIIGSRRFDVRLRNGEDSLFMLQISDKITYLKTTTSDAIYFRRVRANSAATRKRPMHEIVLCKYRLCTGYLKCLIRPWKYNPLLALSRIIACLFNI